MNRWQREDISSLILMTACRRFENVTTQSTSWRLFSDIKNRWRKK